MVNQPMSGVIYIDLEWENDSEIDQMLANSTEEHFAS